MTSRRQLGLPQPRVVQKTLHARARPALNRGPSAVLTATSDSSLGSMWGLWTENPDRRPILRLLSRSIRKTAGEISD
jgi:hypothetical protein